MKQDEQSAKQRAKDEWLSTRLGVPPIGEFEAWDSGYDAGVLAERAAQAEIGGEDEN